MWAMRGFGDLAALLSSLQSVTPTPIPQSRSPGSKAPSSPTDQRSLRVQSLGSTQEQATAGTLTSEVGGASGDVDGVQGGPDIPTVLARSPRGAGRRPCAAGTM